MKAFLETMEDHDIIPAHLDLFRGLLNFHLAASALMSVMATVPMEKREIVLDLFFEMADEAQHLADLQSGICDNYGEDLEEGTLDCKTRDDTFPSC